MNGKRRACCTIAVMSVMLFVVASAECLAQEEGRWTRAGRVEAFALYDYSWLTFSSIFLDATISSHVGGVGVGYNFNDYLNLNTEFSAGAIGVSGHVSEGATIYAWDVNLDCYILGAEYPISPLATVGFGAGLWRSEDEDEDEDHSLGTFRADLGLGLRWDVTDRFFAKALYKPLAMDCRESEPAIQQRIGVYIGYKF